LCVISIEASKSLGLETLGFTQQGLFLMSLGLGDRLTELSTGKFNVAEIFKRRDALHQLIDPTGLGKFGVLLQGKGLTPVQKRRSLKGFSPEK
jgi:SAM-dependent MidA family methyltransferase